MGRRTGFDYPGTDLFHPCEIRDATTRTNANGFVVPACDYHNNEAPECDKSEISFGARKLQIIHSRPDEWSCTLKLPEDYGDHERSACTRLSSDSGNSARPAYSAGGGR